MKAFELLSVIFYEQQELDNAEQSFCETCLSSYEYLGKTVTFPVKKFVLFVQYRFLSDERIFT